MSHSSGAVKFPNGDIYWFEYNGTVDVCMPILYSTNNELHEHWRRNDAWKDCRVDEHLLDGHCRVEIVSTYGGGFCWSGFACSKCKILISPLEVDYNTEMKGLPDWFIEFAAKEGIDYKNWSKI